MPIRDQIMQMASGNPDVEKAVNAIEAQLGNAPIAPGELTHAIKLLEFVLQHPDKYAQVRAAAIADGAIDAGMIPQQFNQTFVVSLLIALYALQDKAAQRPAMAQGGLASLGRGGDTELAHVNPREAEMLRRMGGSGTVNPNTGLREYKGGLLGSILSVAVPIVSTILAPGLGTVISGALGIGGSAAGAAIGTALAGSALGAAGAGLTGGNMAQGAIMGGLGSGAGNLIGSGISNATGLGLDAAQAGLLGNAALGGAAGAATGRGFLQGAGQGVLGGAIGQAAGALGGQGSAIGSALGSAGQTAGNAYTAGYDPKTAATMGALSGLRAGLSFKPSETAISNLEQGNVSNPDLTSVEQSVYGTTPEATSGADVSNLDLSNIEYAPAGNLQSGVDSNVFTTDSRGNIVYKPGYTINTPSDGRGVPQMAVPTQSGSTALADVKGNWVDQNGQMTFKPDTGVLGLGGMKPSVGSVGGGGVLGTGISPTAALVGLGVLSSLSSTPPDVQNEVGKLSAAQQAYMNRPSVKWNWSKLQSDAGAANQSLSQYMAQNWNKLQSGAYNTVAAAEGGPLARYAQGAGTGRSDDIDAKLSDGEYVIDAETVAMLGDGSNKAGAQKLDQMRAEIRKQKGKALAKGKISPNAKSPLTYIKEMA